jgi:NAD(P)-dependent dehydrogenase (short-subunit alcohol dehydrogenase family)
MSCEGEREESVNDPVQHLAGRVELLTGAGRGLGRAQALACAALGAKIVVNDYGGSRDGIGASSAPAQAVVEEIRTSGGEAVAHFGSVTEPDDAAEMVALALERFGALHAVVNNAGILRDRSLLNMTIDEWTQVVDVHLRGTLVMTQAAGRHWRDQAKAGHPVAARIVNTSSGSGLFGNFGQANYSAAKGGIASLTALTAIELGRYGVTANAIAPVGKTRLMSEDPQALKLAEGFDPMDPANVSPLVTWLVSERSGDVTGRIFSVVGGCIGVVEGYLRGPEMQHEHRLSFEDIEAELPAVIDRSRPRTNVFEAHPQLNRVD